MCSRSGRWSSSPVVPHAHGSSLICHSSHPQNSQKEESGEHSNLRLLFDGLRREFIVTVITMQVAILHDGGYLTASAFSITHSVERAWFGCHFGVANVLSGQRRVSRQTATHTLHPRHEKGRVRTPASAPTLVRRYVEQKLRDKSFNARNEAGLFKQQQLGKQTQKEILKVMFRKLSKIANM